MEFFRAIKERLGLGLKGLNIMVISCLIALPFLLMVSMVYPNSSFDIIEEFTGKAKVLPVKANNVTASFNIESEDKSSKPTSLQDANKLLGGLLASGFDEGSCVSRYQSNLYYKTSPYKPSSYLLSKLRKYEDLHQHCGPYTESYNRTLKQLLNSSHISSSITDCNYVLWLPSNGLGNRIVSMAASFVYALLTDRVLLVKYGTDMADLFCEPFLNTSWLLPADFPLWNQFDSADMRNVHSYGNLLKNYNKNISTVSSRPPYLYLYLAYNYDKYDKLFYKDQNQGFLQKVPWLFLRTDQYFVPGLFLMKSFNQEINKLFPDKRTIFHHLGRYLFHSSNQAWGLITRFYQAYLAKAEERISLQIRVFDTKSSPSDLVMKQILACTKKEKLLPQVDAQENTIPSSTSKNQTSKAILITSLYAVYYEHLKNMYWVKPTVIGDVIGVYQPSHEDYQHFGDNMHNMKAWAEIYLLSLSDQVLVTSSWSTFGYVAQGLAGLKPWILFMPYKQMTPDPPCLRAISMEPCFHYPPSYDRIANKIIDDSASLSPNVKACEDVSWGLKLVNDKYH